MGLGGALGDDGISQLHHRARIPIQDGAAEHHRTIEQHPMPSHAMPSHAHASEHSLLQDGVFWFRRKLQYSYDGLILPYLPI